jgi:chromosome segregation protein
MDSTLGRLHRERQVLAAEDPDQLRANLVAAEADRGAAEEGLRAADEALVAATEARAASATTARDTAEAENAANREWRDAAAELERLRDEYESEDRARGDLERRIREHERLLKEGHERDPAEAVASLSADDAPEALEKRADVVQRRLALLGRVNLLATEEFETLQERHDFLARELDDVKKARRDLLEVIRQVDDEVVRLFDQAFRDVAREFEHLFVQLFPGGEGRLVLTDPANLLESGIELEARPGRKRVKRISLLSGGERSLTALAFLFAIFKARPSPFYLLDEVEAALDDTNLVRFIRLIQVFAKDSQVLVVTHQKRTMETADILYGVSMGKDGASAVISQRFDREHDPEALAHEAAEQHVVEVPEAQPDAVR